MHKTHRTPQVPIDSIGIVVCKSGRPEAALGLAQPPQACEALLEAMRNAGDRAMFPVTLPQGAAIGFKWCHQNVEIGVVRPTSVEATLLDFVVAVPFAFDILEQILNDPYRAITVADHTGTIRYISPVHERFLGLPHGGGIGKRAEDAIPNSRLREVIKSGKAEIGKPLKLSDGVTRVVSRRPIWKDGVVVGAVGQVMFRDTEAVSQMASEINQLRSQVEFYRKELDDLRESREGLAELIGESQAMQRLRREISTVARLDVPVLVRGESGTGKELVARAIHHLGRPGQAMVSLNLAALPVSLVESELFGHIGGAFTGSARQGRAGKFEMAHDGTLFLDEVGDIPLDIQVKLLRILEDRTVERLGSNTSKPTTFRLVAATHRNMEEALSNGQFRQDLYYRISGVTLHVPPLRERLEDIPALLEFFVESFCKRNRLPIPRIDGNVAAYLADQPWPGNLRQLRHRVEEALVFGGPHLLTTQAFARHEGGQPAPADSPSNAAATRALRSPLLDRDGASGAAQSLREQEQAAALRALAQCGGNKMQAARQLGISRSYLYKLLAGVD